ncbi:MAG: hypothetical protein OJF47_002220 [Nitrospira sp.]|nr:MAG: hypothetical protein OJF47_002220 [Nitrospira sp.]
MPQPTQQARKHRLSRSNEQDIVSGRRVGEEMTGFESSLRSDLRQRGVRGRHSPRS